MALGATAYHFQIELSDVDRSVYQSLDLRLAMHPSETMRFMLLRTLAYCLEVQEGLAFSKGGLSANEEPPLSVRDLTGQLLAWIDIGNPAAERLHKAAKAAARVAVYSDASADLLRKEASSRSIFNLEKIEVLRFNPAFVRSLEPHVERRTSFQVTRNDGVLYVELDGHTFETPVERVLLSES
jgi:uncharacterized protein YaeQ